MKILRGFATMSKERLLQVASRGGKVAHEIGKAHKWNGFEAQLAGRIGGQTYRKSCLNTR